MKNAPNSKANLDRAIQRYAGDNVRAVEFRVSMANAIVAQMIGQGVVKGGSGLKFRYGDRATRVTIIDWSKTAEVCRRLFFYRKCQPWPPTIVKGDSWDSVYNAQRLDLPVLPTVDEAVAWANNLIAKITAAT